MGEGDEGIGMKLTRSDRPVNALRPVPLTQPKWA